MTTEGDEEEQIPNGIAIQSLASIVNHPKNESMLKKLGKYVKNGIQGKRHATRTGSKKFTYKVLTEKDIHGSLHIPKVTYPKDFQKALD